MACGNYAFFNFQLLLNLWTQSCQKKFFIALTSIIISLIISFLKSGCQESQFYSFPSQYVLAWGPFLLSFPTPRPQNGQIVGLMINN